MFGQHHDNNLPEPATDTGTDDNTAPAVTDDSAGAYLDDVSPVPAPASTPAVDETPVASSDVPEPAAVTAPAEPVAAAAVVPADTDKLLDIKQQALQQLTPLVGHLEQNPEEKFRTTMMMIQASDNHELVSAAYEAAQQITDEKVRAQALLDIVNEINYFTHNGPDSEAAA
jgi:hypothetical protein